MSRSYVVRCDYAMPTKDGGTRQLTTWWYGPERGFGTTSGQREHAQAFTSRLAAENALRRTYGTMACAKRHGYKVVPA